MADDGHEFLQPADDVAADDLHVIEIELHADVRLAGLGDDVGGVLDAVEEIIRPVDGVDRLDQQVDILGGGEIGGAFADCR